MLQPSLEGFFCLGSGGNETPRELVRSAKQENVLLSSKTGRLKQLPWVTREETMTK